MDESEAKFASADFRSKRRTKIPRALARGASTRRMPISSVFIFILLVLLTRNVSAQSCNTGDGNGDGKVDGFDYVIWWQNFGQNVSGVANGDFNCSGKVDGFDYVIWWQNFGNVAGTPTPTSPPISPPPQGVGIWISQSQLMSRPTSGSAWDAMYSDASGSWGSANVSDQDSGHDQSVMAGALVCARKGEFCDKTRQGLLSAIGTESGARWLAIGRNMLGYTIAADVMRNSGNLTGNDLSQVTAWLASFLTRKLAQNNTGEPVPFYPFGSGSNASAQEGSVYAAIATYLGDSAPTITHPLTGATVSGKGHINRAWNAFRRYSCGDGAPDDENMFLHDSTWRFDAWPENAGLGNPPCGVNPKGSIAKQSGQTYSIDGAIPNDMRRASSNFTWPPGHTSYPWVGLEGYVPAALILHRAGYPAFQLKDQAVFRTHQFLCYLKKNTSTDWWEPGRANEAKHLVKVAYGYNDPSCSIDYPSGGGRTFGYTDWTHPTGI